LNKFFEFKGTTPKKYFTKNKKISDYSHDLKIFARWLEDTRKLSPKCVSTYLGATVSYFSANDIELPRKIWKELQVKSYAMTNDGIISKEILRQILTHTDACGKAIFLLSASSGMRIEDTLNLSLKQVLEAMKNNPARMRIVQLKTRNPQDVYFSKEACDAIREWIKARNTYLTTGVNHCVRGKYYKKSLDDVRLFPFTYNSALNLWNKAIQASGYATKDEKTNRHIYHIHGLRKFFRSQCTVASVEANVAEMFLGHINGLSQYHQYTPEFIAQQYRKFEDKAKIMVDHIENPETLTKLEQMERIIRTQEQRIKILDQAMKQTILHDLEQHPESKKIWKDYLQ